MNPSLLLSDASKREANVLQRPANARFAAQLRSASVIFLLVIGFCLFAFANSLGVTLVSANSGGNAIWITEHAGRAASVLRLVGLMLFGAGVIERVLLRVGSH